MTKSNSITGDEIKNTKLKDLLMQSTKERLLRTARMTGANLKTSAKKDFIADMIVVNVLTRPEEFLEHLTLYELEMVKLICDSSDDSGVEGADMAQQMSLYEMGIMSIYDVIGEEGVEMYDLPRDLRHVLKEHVDETIDKKRKNDEHLLETVVIGFLNLFGVIGFETFKGFISNVSGKSEDEIEDFLRGRFIFDGKTIIFGTGTELIASPFFDYDALDDIIDTIMQYKDIRYYYDAPQDTVIGWGFMPFPVENAPYAKKLLSMLRKKIKRPGIAEAALTHFWLSCQLNTNPTDAISELMHYIDFGDQSEARKVLVEVMNFNNKMPRWLFRGHSSDDVAKINPNKANKLHIVSAPMSKTGYISKPPLDDYDDNDDFEALLYKGIDPRTGKKIRPNDPCPCGSGKKYKKCHGRLPS